MKKKRPETVQKREMNLSESIISGKRDGNTRNNEQTISQTETTLVEIDIQY